MPPSGTAVGPSLDEYVAGVRGGDRAMLARAITLVESRRSDRATLAQQVLAALLPATGSAARVGVSGVPGAGKSTFIDALGVWLVERGHRVAVLAVDPSSTLSGGSILGDKSRMPRLAALDAAFIRPSPSAQSLGGVTRRSRETLLLCEAAGYDVVLVETVGVGQSETLVADMVDFFLVLMLAGAGDELQGIKKGILELADLVAINKADGANLERARAAASEYAAALRYQRPRKRSWVPSVLTVSGLTGDGLAEVWALVERHQAELAASGDLDELRRQQRRRWMWGLIEERLDDAFRSHPEVAARLAAVERRVLEGRSTPAQAAADLLGAFGIGGGGPRSG